MAERSYPASQVRGGGREEQSQARGQGRRPGGPTPHPRSRGCLGAGGLEELSHVEGQEGPLGYKVKVTQSCLTLCDPMDYTVRGILQATILDWVAFPFSRGSSQPRDRTQVSSTARGFFTS